MDLSIKFTITHLELHSVKPGTKEQGPKAKNTDQPSLPKPNAPQMDLFADF